MKKKLIRVSNALLLTEFKHIFKIMKITSLLGFVCVASAFAAPMDAQTMRVDISANQTPAKEVIKQIEEQTDYLFVYNKKVNLNNKVTLDASDITVAEALNSIFSGTDIVYAMEGNNILLMNKKEDSVQQSEKTKQITGTVVDASGIPVIGANVMVKGTTNGTITDMDGKFVLEVPEGAVLEVSYIGYLSQSVKVTDNKVSVTLKEDTQKLDEVVVVGYGTMKKGEIASAISSIKSDKFIKTPTTDAAQLIKGQVPGLSISTPDANPTSTSEISLRGITTLKSNSSPLVLIDGIPGELNSVSPDDIAQIDVLKDGSAASIYGTRGTNGVIIITTKNTNGETPTVVDVNTYISTQQIIKKLPFLTAEEYRYYAKKGIPGAIDEGASVNWLDEVTQTPFTQIYNISLRGGSKTTNYVASFEYRGINGLIKRTNNQMFYPRIEITHRMFNNKLKLNASLSGYKQSFFSGSNGGSYNSDVYRMALQYNPTTPVYDSEGNYSESTRNDYSNPVALLNEVEGNNQSTNLRMFANVTFTPIEGLDIKYLISSNTKNQIWGYYETQKHISTWKSEKNGFASRGTTRMNQDLSEITIQWRKTLFKDHSFMLLAGYSWQKDHYQKFYMTNFDFPSDDYTYNNIGLGQALSDGRATEYSIANESVLLGYFTRLNYNYKGKYMLAASLRHEGSSKFGSNHKWGNFPSVSAAWNIKSEEFLKDVSFVSDLKLRVGYGITGTVPTEPYMSLNTLGFNEYVYYDNNWIKTIRPDSNSNPELRWEKKKEFNIGLDYALFSNRISGTVDIYSRKTDDLLWDYTVPSPPYLYSTMVANAGSIKNAGIELGINIVPIQTKSFYWQTSLNYSINKNELVSLSNDNFISSGYSDQGSTGGPINSATHRIQEGEPLGNFYGYKTIDIDDTGHWIIEGEDGTPKPISELLPSDKKIIGNGLPDWFLNWNNSLSWKGFDLGITMRGAFGFDILNMPRLQYGSPYMLSRGNVLKESFDMKYGKAVLSPDQEIQYISYYIEKGDYWKIDNVTLGYTFNIDKIVKRIRIYGTVSNLATITAYKGLDPEVSTSGLAPGIDNKNRYPSTRTYTLGLSFKF